MTPGKLDLDIYRGDTYRYRFTFWADADQTVPEDLTGATVKAELRDEPGGRVFGEMACTVTLPNIIEGVLIPGLTASIPTVGGFWDLQLTYFGTDVYTVLAGAVKLTPDITDSGGLSNARRRIQ